MTIPEHTTPSSQQPCDQEEEMAAQEEEQTTTTLTEQYVQCARMQFHAYCQQHPSLRQALSQVTVIAHETVARMTTAAEALALLHEHPRWVASYPQDCYADASPSSRSFDNQFTILDLVRRHLELYLTKEMGRRWQEERT